MKTSKKRRTIKAARDSPPAAPRRDGVKPSPAGAGGKVGGDEHVVAPPAPPAGRPRPRIPWAEIRLRYVTGVDAPTMERLATEFKISKNSIGLHAKKEDWSGERKKHLEKIRIEAGRKIEKKQAYDLADTVKILTGLISENLKAFKTEAAEWKSKEGISREIREAIKLLNMYLGAPTERMEFSEEHVKKMADFMETLPIAAQKRFIAMWMEESPDAGVADDGSKRG